MNKVHKHRFVTRIPAAVICLLLFALLEGAAIHFDGFSQTDLYITAGLCLAAILLCLIPFRTPWPVGIVALLTVPSICFLLLESFTHIVWETMQADAIVLNLIFYYLLFFFLYLITGRLRTALIIEVLFTMLTGIANYFVILFRSTPILPWDFLSLGTALSVADNYTFSITHLFAQLAGGFILLFIFCCRMPAMRLSSVTRRLPHILFGAVIRVILILLLCIPASCYVGYIFQPDIAEKTSLDNTLFTPKYMYKTNGFYVAFLMDLRLLQVDEPDGYSADTAKALLDEYKPASFMPDERPSVIVIMNECFSDPAVLGEFDTNIDYMPNVSALLDGTENTISGYAYASVLGGNTANSEYEFLTGNTMAFLPSGSVPYQQYIQGEVPTIVDQFKEMGYETYAMHPYGATGWNRDKVYPWMHFDQSLFYSDFKNKVKLRKYVSDASDYENVLNIYNSTEEPVFIFNVTMQNHSGYGDAYDNITPEVTARLKNTKTNKYLNNYLSLIKVSDQAIANLLSALENEERPTIVVFFGDHQPNDYVVNPIYKEHGLNIENQTLEQQQKRQAVPFFIWANYDIEEASDLSISINYLSSLLFDTAGLPMNSYQRFLYELYRQLPVVNAVGYIDDSSVHNYIGSAPDDINSLLDTYRILQYYNMFEN